LTGVVTDPTHAVVPGAEIEIEEQVWAVSSVENENGKKQSWKQ